MADGLAISNLCFVRAGDLWSQSKGSLIEVPSFAALTAFVCKHIYRARPANFATLSKKGNYRAGPKLLQDCNDQAICLFYFKLKQVFIIRAHPRFKMPPG